MQLYLSITIGTTQPVQTTKILKKRIVFPKINEAPAEKNPIGKEFYMAVIVYLLIIKRFPCHPLQTCSHVNSKYICMLLYIPIYTVNHLHSFVDSFHQLKKS